MSKKVVTNTWSDGLNNDLNPVVTPNTVLTDNLNGTFITYNGNELTLQNDVGNIFKSSITPGFCPIGIAEYGGIAYIVSIKPNNKTISIKLKESNKNSIRTEVERLKKQLALLEYDTSSYFLEGLFEDRNVINVEDLNVITTGAKICNISYELLDEDSDENVNTFEVGSFPSLNPDCLRSVNDIEQDSKVLPFEYVYRPLHNMIQTDNLTNVIKETAENLVPFRTNNLPGYDLYHPVHIEIQPSYDGSVNLILTDGKNPIRLINTGFASIGNNKGKFIRRKQNVKTNYYNENILDQLTKLVRTTECKIAVDYNKVQSGGQLKGGNYTFYVRLGDDDGNKTDIVGESGIFSIFHGTIGDPRSISGAFADEITDKLIALDVIGVDTTYSKIYLSYVRETCDLNGERVTKAYDIVKPYDVSTEERTTIIINGTEEIEDISLEELNVAYYNVGSAKTIAQQQGMLFLGNVSVDVADDYNLQELSYNIKVCVKEKKESIGKLDRASEVLNSSDGLYIPIGGSMYYDPENIYRYVGYWPDELYRFGVVYMKNGGVPTQVYNLKGCIFDTLGEYNLDPKHTYDFSKNTSDLEIDNSERLSDSINVNGDNKLGVFKTPYVDLINSKAPLYFEFSIDEETQHTLADLGITGYFIVRQKRLPITLCQGMMVGINKYSHYPMLNASANKQFLSQSFLDVNYLLRYFGSGQKSSSENYGKICYKYITTIIKPTKIKILGLWTVTKPIAWYRVIGPKGGVPDYVYGDYYTEKDARKALSEIKGTELQEILIDNCSYNYKKFSVANVNGDQKYIDFIRDYTNYEQYGAGLISVEANVDPNIQSLLNGSRFDVKAFHANSLGTTGGCKSHFYAFTPNDINISDRINNHYLFPSKLVYIPEGTAYKSVDGVGFSNMVGDGIHPQEFGYIQDPDKQKKLAAEDSSVNSWNFYPIRGLFTPYIAMPYNVKEGGLSESIITNVDNDTGEVTTTKVDKLTQYDPRVSNVICNIRIPTSAGYYNEILVRGGDNSPFYCVSDRNNLSETLEIYRGDCYICQTTVRMHRNFIDQDAPVANKIVQPECWRNWFRGEDNVLEEGESQPKKEGTEEEDEANRKTDWSKINIGDLNTVSLGHWVTFTCLSNLNLGLRSIDTTHADEMALMGNPRSFYPVLGISTETGMKLPESTLFNMGYGAALGRKQYLFKEQVPYNKNEFSTRVMFSNVSVTDAFINGYRVFQGLSYKDFTKQYGSIVKLLPWGNNLFIVFEHGLAIAPVNEKALLQTTTEQTIHIYGHDVLTDQLAIISQDFGSTWADSVIRTPIGIYGFDTSAKKIWRYSDKKGLETISDMKVQRFLNDNTIIALDKGPNLGFTNVKTHYNNYKGDVMFTFYDNGKSWNLCYNERQGLWVTKYDWIPLLSANIDNTFYSINNPFESGRNAGIYKHGKTLGGDDDFRPCLWYGKQSPFEFEFVVTDPAGVQKIFDNLAIISNNVQPYEIDFEFVGDSYLFNRSKVYHDYKSTNGPQLDLYGNWKVDKPYVKDGGKDTYYGLEQLFYNVDEIKYDSVLDQYTLVIKQPCKNKDSYGLRLGNIQYKEDCWYTNIEPLRYNEILKNPDMKGTPNFVSARLRDKWIKIKIKYKGDQLALINAVSTFENISYA